MKLTEDNRKIYQTFWKNNCKFPFNSYDFRWPQPAMEQDLGSQPDTELGQSSESTRS